ncbi:MAG TPA: ABC transporter permease subunit, partial [Steroidobacteraceae bacterium]|nr:ABC transporter permease subunit [Steroidobacteraceae bacterium]
MRLDRLPISVLRTRYVPGGWDVLAFVLIFVFFIYLAQAAHGLSGSLARLEATPISLEPRALAGYSARTALRMVVAMLASLAFTFTYATLAAKSRRAEVILVPLLDFLQSVPILSFSSITILFFLQLTPGRVAGAELAAVFLIFTSQAWNMAFSFYHSLRSIPDELAEAARNFQLGPWVRFWRLEVPFAMPPLIWNMMMSMSGGWFFVVASEAISVGNTTVTLPGVGSYIALAIEQKNLAAIGWAIAAMFLVILIFDQLLFRPLIASADWFRLEQEAGFTATHSWALTMMRRSRLLRLLSSLFAALLRAGIRPQRHTALPGRAASLWRARWIDFLWYGLLVLLGIAALWKAAHFVRGEVPAAEIGRVLLYGVFTMARVAILIALASLVWVPIGVWVGLRPGVANIVQPIAQFLAAFPANLFFPFVFSAIVLFKLTPDIWLSPLMILGTQWYILFNVIVGASSIAPELRYASENLGVRG